MKNPATWPFSYTTWLSGGRSSPAQAWARHLRSAAAAAVAQSSPRARERSAETRGERPGAFLSARWEAHASCGPVGPSSEQSLSFATLHSPLSQQSGSPAAASTAARHRGCRPLVDETTTVVGDGNNCGPRLLVTMGSTCENCMRWWDHQDRNCAGNEQMSFHVIAYEDFRSYMRMPQEFGSHFRRLISDTIKLNAPNGCVYDIEICREMGEIVLRSGWDVFATAHNLEQNECLVFNFCGNSSFKVQIYNLRGGFQKIASHVNPHPENIEVVLPCTTCGHHDSNGHVRSPARFDYFTSGGSRLTKAQDKKVLEMACTIRPEIPLYVAVMNKSNIDLKSCFISIPSIIMTDDRDEVFKATVKLEAPDSNVYNVSASQQNGDEIVLQSGWVAFVVAHHVQERDLIIFRYKGNSRFEVFILEPNGCEKTCSWFGLGDNSNTSNYDNIVAAPTAKSSRRQKQLLGHCVKSRRMASTSCTSSKSGDEADEDLHASVEDGVDQRPSNSNTNSNNTEGPSWPPYFISKQATLSRAEEDMVLEKVQEIASKFPIHVSVMNQSTIGVTYSKKMKFSMEYARRFLPSTTQTLTLQLEGCQSKQWRTVLHVAGGLSRSRGERRINSGWARFISDNRLSVRDICLFELVETTRLKMKVHLIRKAEAHIEQ